MKKQRTTVLICVVILFILIMDTRTVVLGAKEGIDLCLSTVIPSLFPFFVISSILNANLLGIQLPGLKRLGKLCRIPSGTESIFLLGCLGGYPVGAKCIEECFLKGQIDRNTSARMLGFCSNCGPAFIFGICGSLFTNWSAPWLLWIIQVASALITALLLSKETSFTTRQVDKKHVTIQTALKNSIRTTADVCGWIIIFRVIITLANRWVLWSIPNRISVILTGLLELANGCTGLSAIAYEPARFILCGCYLSFGGICVLMQTVSVTESCGLGLYIPGKLIQTGISYILSVMTASALYPNSFSLQFYIAAAIIVALIPILKVTILRKKDSHIEKVVV